MIAEQIVPGEGPIGMHYGTMQDHQLRESLSANRIMGFSRVIELFTTNFTRFKTFLV